MGDDAPDTYSWIPFGGGIRRCLGASFALYEMQVVIPAILRAVQLRAAGAAPERIRRRAVTFVPEHDGRVVVEAFRQAPAAVAAA
jgi:cytochrome P450